MFSRYTFLIRNLMVIFKYYYISLSLLILFSANIFLISWRIFTKSIWGLLDKPQKCDRSKSSKKGISELIIDNIYDLVKELSVFWRSASSRVIGIGCQMSNKVFLINFTLINSILFILVISLNLFISSLKV